MNIRDRMSPAGYLEGSEVSVQGIRPIAVIHNHEVSIPGELIGIGDGPFMDDPNGLTFGHGNLETAPRDGGAKPAARLASKPSGDDSLGRPRQRAAEGGQW